MVYINSTQAYVKGMHLHSFIVYELGVAFPQVELGLEFEMDIIYRHIHTYLYIYKSSSPLIYALKIQVYSKSTNTNRNMFKIIIIIRRVLEYASGVWGGFSALDVEKLQNVQFEAARTGLPPLVSNVSTLLINVKCL